MARVTPADLARLEQDAAKAKAAFEVRQARVRRAQQQQRAEHEQAIVKLMREMGLLAYDVETLRVPLTTLAQQMQAAVDGGNAQTGESPA